MLTFQRPWSLKISIFEKTMWKHYRWEARSGALRKPRGEIPTEVSKGFPGKVPRASSGASRPGPGNVLWHKVFHKDASCPASCPALCLVSCPASCLASCLASRLALCLASFPASCLDFCPAEFVPDNTENEWNLMKGQWTNSQSMHFNEHFVTSLWRSMNIIENPLKFNEHLWKSLKIKWKSGKNIDMQWRSTKKHWKTFGNIANPWVSMSEL